MDGAGTVWHVSVFSWPARGFVMGGHAGCALAEGCKAAGNADVVFKMRDDEERATAALLL